MSGPAPASSPSPDAAAKAPGNLPSPSFSDLTRERPFMQMWTARLFGTAASQMLLVAIGWHMYELTGSAWDLGLVGLYQFVPALLLALLAGHIVDRHHRGRIVAACFAVQGLVALVLLLAVQEKHDTRGLLLGLSLVLGAVRAFQMPAQQALTPLLVPPTMLARAMAFSSAGMQGAIIGGPALGGLLFVAGMAVVYGASVAFFAVACALVLRLRYAYTPAMREPVTLGTVFAGVDFIWKRKPVLGAVSLDLFAVLLGGAVALLPIYAKDILHTGPWGLGLLRGAPAVGALVMSIVLTRRPVERHIGRTLLLAIALFGVCMVVFGLSKSFVVSLIALAVSGGADMVNVVIRQTLVQLETPDAMRGRVSAVNSIFIGASNQLGEFESGATAALLGPVGSVVVGGVGTVLVALTWFRLFPSLAQRDRMVVVMPAAVGTGTAARAQSTGTV
ncbi:MFS transporter [Variovorax sp. KBW07]|uniref:MFS transporter n=1 Tax=Variovorax sp. KBW07 TaxID=2153358 RepID=UPI0021AA4B84|nr:MFS transporter [Variovorax sp. KBW07]